MNPEIKRILKLVENGKLTSVEGIELIEALEKEAPVEEAKAEPKSKKTKAKSESDATEEPPQDQKSETKPPKEPFKSFLDALHQGLEELNRVKINFSLTRLDRFRVVRTPLTLDDSNNLRIEGPHEGFFISRRHGLDEAVSTITIHGDVTEEVRKATDDYALIVEEKDGSVTLRRPEMPAGVSVCLGVHLKRASIGAITIEPSADVEAEPKAAEKPKAAKEPKAKPATKAEILEQLERGEISAAEAKRKMKEGEQA